MVGWKEEIVLCYFDSASALSISSVSLMIPPIIVERSWLPADTLDPSAWDYRKDEEKEIELNQNMKTISQNSLFWCRVETLFD
ncbi:hypothetical protein AAHA92_03931 [Salvia divinorum]|uniref:Uncharacterized protein n=1 Tax=Salvia divinorum TaxID=28513 RepID=A0ABD1HZF5_SALDI